MSNARFVRDKRQRWMNELVTRLFGSRFLSRRCRIERIFEEAAELGQALDYPEEEAVRIVRLAYQGKKGEVPQEIGGLSVCLLSLCETLGYSADQCELDELIRLDKKRPEDLAEKLKAKIASGIVTNEAA